MTLIDIPTIERQARELRAAEMRGQSGLFAERSAQVASLAAGSALLAARAMGEVLRPLFAWNPQASQFSIAGFIEPVVARLNAVARSLFSWNPQEHRS